MSDILIFAEQRGGRFHPAVFQLITAAKEIDDAAQISVCIIGRDLASLAREIGAYGVHRVLTADDAQLERYRPQPYARVLQMVVDKVQPQIVLLPSTFLGRDVAPRLAVKTGGALATDCTGMQRDGQGLIATRASYVGKATAELRLPANRLNILTIRPNTYAAAPQSGSSASAEPVPVALDGEDLKLVNQEWVSTTSGVKDVTEADIVVSGGRSLKSEENFKILHDLAAPLDAAVGASRAACDAGYQPHSRQVGLTGKTVTPKLYLAFGIDGAIQHLAGMRGSKCIVAVNTKKEAPIFGVSDYGCVADLFEMAPLLTEEFKKALDK